MSKFTKFPSIESFAHVNRRKQKDIFSKPVDYIAKVKLHGTNAAVRVSADGGVFAQSRNRNLTPDDDNFGFATWLEGVKGIFANAWDLEEGREIIFYGEWAGNGVQDTDAVNLTDCRKFYIFAVQWDGKMISHPGDIEYFAPIHDDIEIVPEYDGLGRVVDFGAGVEGWLDDINAEIEAIQTRDPYIFEKFGISGSGEGLVFSPRNQTNTGDWAADTFKAKSAAHRVNKSKKAAEAKGTIPAGTREFVDTFVTEARCKQAITEACGGVASAKSIPDFLKWVGNDVRKESERELKEMGVEWGAVAKAVNQVAVRWYKTTMSKS